MVCLGTARLPADYQTGEAAQLWTLQCFRTDFLRRYPTGIVISELEYSGAWSITKGQTGPIKIPGKPVLSRIMDALAQDFRRWSKENDFRKCDMIGISNDGHHAELAEVTTIGNAASAIGQMKSKLDILNHTVNKIHKLQVRWQATKWKPKPFERFHTLRVYPGGIKYLCYEPTMQPSTPDGIVLYEVHELKQGAAPQQSPVPIPQHAAEKLRHAFKQVDNMEEKARAFILQNPDMAIWIRAAAAVLSVGALVMLIAGLITPVPGDEIAAFAFCGALVRVATAKQ